MRWRARVPANGGRRPDQIDSLLLSRGWKQIPPGGPSWYCATCFPAAAAAAPAAVGPPAPVQDPILARAEGGETRHRRTILSDQDRAWSLRAREQIPLMGHMQPALTRLAPARDIWDRTLAALNGFVPDASGVACLHKSCARRMCTLQKLNLCRSKADG